MSDVTANDGAAEPTEAAAAPIESAETAVNGDASAESHWYDGIEDADVKAWAASRGYTGLQDAARGHMNLEKMRNVPADRLLELPEDMAAEGAMDGIWKKLGRPDDWEGYGLAKPEDLEDEAWSDDYAQHMAKAAHKYGVSKAAMEGLFGAQLEFSKMLGTQIDQENKNAAVNLDAELREKWGTSYADNMNFAKLGAELAGEDEKAVTELLGRDSVQTKEFWVRLGQMRAESKMPADALSGSGPSLDQQIRDIEGDPEFDKYMTLRGENRHHTATEEQKQLAQRRTNLIRERAKMRSAR